MILSDTRFAMYEPVEVRESAPNTTPPSYSTAMIVVWTQPKHHAARQSAPTHTCQTTQPQETPSSGGRAHPKSRILYVHPRATSRCEGRHPAAPTLLAAAPAVQSKIRRLNARRKKRRSAGERPPPRFLRGVLFKAGDCKTIFTQLRRRLSPKSCCQNVKHQSNTKAPHKGPKGPKHPPLVDVDQPLCEIFRCSLNSRSLLLWRAGSLRSFAATRKEAELFCGSLLRKGKVLAYVGLS